jgi:hypothetical protein
MKGVEAQLGVYCKRCQPQRINDSLTFMKQKHSRCFQEMMGCPRAPDSNPAVNELTRAEPRSTVRDGSMESKLYQSS